MPMQETMQIKTGEMPMGLTEKHRPMIMNYILVIQFQTIRLQGTQIIPRSDAPRPNG